MTMDQHHSDSRCSWLIRLPTVSSVCNVTIGLQALSRSLVSIVLSFKL